MKMNFLLLTQSPYLKVSSSLTGTIPTELGQLKNLVRLELCKNFLFCRLNIFKVAMTSSCAH